MQNSKSLDRSMSRKIPKKNVEIILRLLASSLQVSLKSRSGHFCASMYESQNENNLLTASKTIVINDIVNSGVL